MDGPIKIGCSSLPERRLKALMTWSPLPLEIVAAIPGGYQLERNIHECFADLHLHREWFKAGERLLVSVERLKSGKPVEEAINLKNRLGSIKKGRCGGASWNNQTRQKMSVLHRVRFALKRIGVDNHYLVPAALKDVVDASAARALTADERARLDAFVTNPEPFKAECQARFRDWKSRWHKTQPPSASVTTTGEAA